MDCFLKTAPRGSYWFKSGTIHFIFCTLRVLKLVIQKARSNKLTYQSSNQPMISIAQPMWYQWCETSVVLLLRARATPRLAGALRRRCCHAFCAPSPHGAHRRLTHRAPQLHTRNQKNCAKMPEWTLNAELERRFASDTAGTHSQSVANTAANSRCGCAACNRASGCH